MGICVRSSILGAAAVIALALPAWAGHKLSTQFDTNQTTTIGSTTLSPGQYDLKTEEGANQLEVDQDGKIVAQVPCHWVQLSSKPSDTAVLVDENTVKEVDFAGRTQAVRFDSVANPN
jgi:hypothetical protein